MPQNKSYQDLKKELDDILRVLQSDAVDVDEAMQAYERGMEVVASLEEYLKDAENKITKLKERFDA